MNVSTKKKIISQLSSSKNPGRTSTTTNKVTPSLTMARNVVGITPKGQLHFRSKPKKKAISIKSSDVSKFNKHGTIQSNFELIVPVFKNLLPMFSKSEMANFIRCVVDAHNGFITHLGIKYGTKHYKEICNYCSLLIEGRQAEPVDRVSLGRTDRWPNVFGGLRPLFRMIMDHPDKQIKANALQLLLTLFKLNKVCESFHELEVDDLQQTFELDPVWVKGFKDFVGMKIFGDWNMSQLDNLVELRVSEPLFGSSNGPNGVSKMQSAPEEAEAILSSELAGPFQDYCKASKNLDFHSWVSHMASPEARERHPKGNSNKRKRSKTVLRKLVSIPDAGNKSRVIAICDFFTQSLLTPLESFINKLLISKFRESSAFTSHSKGFDSVKSSCDETWVSLDAKAWTDNLPSRLQYIVLMTLFGKELAYAWRKLAVECKWILGNTDLTVNYGKGQGMGTKGSFTIASLTDHLVIEYVMQQHYGKVLPYMKVGDDLVVSDPDRIFEKFYPTIGVPIQITKSKMNSPNGHFVEFVSRLLWDKRDISPISGNLLAKARKQPYLLPVLAAHLGERTTPGGPPNLESLVQCIKISDQARQDLYNIVQAVNWLMDKTIFVLPPIAGLSDKDMMLLLFRMITTLPDSIAEVQIAETKVPVDTVKLYEIFNQRLDEPSGATWLPLIQHNLSLQEIRQLLFYEKKWNKLAKWFSDDSLVNLDLVKNPTESIESFEEGVVTNQRVLELAKWLALDLFQHSLNVKNNLTIVESLSSGNSPDCPTIVELYSKINRFLKQKGEPGEIPANMNVYGYEEVLLKRLKDMILECKETTSIPEPR